MWLLAAAILIGAGVWAFLIRRDQAFDDLGLFNPPYMYVHYGAVTYPAHGQFETMTVHPPLQYWELGVLLRAGLPPFYAEAVAPLAMIVVATLLIARSAFPNAVKAGLLLALTVPYLAPKGVSIMTAGNAFVPSMRPDVHRGLALFAGLVALETGRLQNWSPGRLALGSALLTHSAALHYPGFATWTGALVYVVWAVIERGWRAAARPLLALVGGGCAVGVPYLILFVVPQWSDISGFIHEVDPTGGIGASLEIHRKAYRVLSGELAQAWPTRILFAPMALGLPLIVVATAALLAVPATRGIALAGLPYPAFLLLFTTHKLAWRGYFLPELMLYVAGIGVLAASVLSGVAGRVAPCYRWLVLLLAGGAGITGVLLSSPVPSLVELSLRPRVHAAEAARAAGRAMLGPKALVGSRSGVLFYASGAAHFYDVAPDLLYGRPLPRDLAAYFDDFDGIVEFQHGSHITHNEEGESLASWYAGGVLQLKGFHLWGEWSPLTYLVLGARRTAPRQGYGVLASGEVTRFREAESGDHIFVSLVCDVDARPIPGHLVRFRGDYRLPGGKGADRELTTFLIQTDHYHAVRSDLGRACLIRDEIPLRAEPVERPELLATLAGDPPIRFHRHLEDALEARHGPEAEISLTTDGWPTSLRFRRGLQRGRAHPLAGTGTHELFRSEMDGPAGWEINRHYASGGLQIVPQGLGAGSSSARYSSGGEKDHLASSFTSLRCGAASGVFFSVWARPGAQKPPQVALQDGHYVQLARARPRLQRGNWMLLAGWSTKVPVGRVRMVISEAGGGAVLLDKALMVEMVPASGGCP